MATPIIMPKQGNTVEECLLTEWRVAEGDSVAAGDVVADIETDKATFEVESTAAGTVLALFWEEGELVPVLETICVVGEEGEDIAEFRPEGAEEQEAGEAPAEKAEPEAGADEVEEEAEPADAPESGASEEESVEGRTSGEAPLSPRARTYLREHPFTLPDIKGSGAGGRIIEADVIKAYRESAKLSPTAVRMAEEGMATPAEGTGVRGMVTAEDMRQAAASKGAAAEATVVTAEAEDEITEIPLSNIRKIIAGRLHESSTNLVQYTLNAEADVTELLALRKQIKDQGEALGLGNVNVGDMVMFGTIKALQRHPEANAEFEDDTIRQHSAVHIGFACDTPRGLMVPVLHNAHALSLAQISQSVKALARQANEGALSPDHLQGGTFTVSNLGALGVTTFTPVINAPQVGILGVGTTVLRPVRTGDGVEYRDMMQLSLTLDHRVVDGAPGARFLKTLVAMIENIHLVCVAG